MEFKHISVLLKECIDGLKIDDQKIYVDGTLGGGGHSFHILSSNNSIRLIGIDQDQDAIKAASQKLEIFGDRFISVQSNFEDIDKVLDSIQIFKVDGILIDLGVSSYQLDNSERGFSYNYDGPLDMRMNVNSQLKASEIINNYSHGELTRIIREYGEENFASKIASKIIDNRPINSTIQLAEIIKNAQPAATRRTGPHPAKRTFQAIRIAVNDELGVIKRVIKKATDRLNKGGRLCIITFHSLEDRIVKQEFKELAKGCTCPKELPKCICGKNPIVEIVTKKPILPTDEEINFNPRSRSAKLRICEKL